ncbi:MAG: fibronectin type III domain-containing protein [Nitrosopumilaceae archaeon]
MTFMNQKLLLLLVGLSLCSVLSLESHVAYAAIPDRPTNLQAIDVSPTKVDLFWNTPENNGGSAITGYKIEFKTSSGSYSTLPFTGTGTTFSHTGLITGTTYIYRVSSINAQGTSDPSAETIATPTSSSQPLENIVPNTPTSLTASDISQTSIKLSWIKPATNNGPPVTGYKIEFKKDSGSFTTLVENTGSTITTYTHPGLTTNSKYTYKISAKNSVGFSPTSNEASATPKSTSSPPTENIAPNPPRSLTAQSAGPTQIFLSWKEPTPNNGPAITGYKIESKTTGDYTVLTTTGNTTSFTHTGLTSGTQYSYRVFAINSAGTSIASSAASAKPSDTIVPTNLIADDISPTEILLTWIAPSQTYGGTISGYIISKKFAADVYDSIGETNGPQTSFTVTGLHTGTEYTFAVKARYNIGTSSDYSSPASATPTTSSKPPSKFTVPNAPAGLTATASSPIQIDLVWNAPTNDGGSQITGYKIDVKTGTGAYVTLKENTGSTARTYTHTERTTGITYTYKVYAINSVGTSGPSNEASATPAASAAPPVSKTKPSQPSSLVATAVSQNQINLSWKLPTNDGGEPVNGYKIESSEGVGNYKVLSQNTGKNTAYSHTGLKPETSYYYRVYAINSIGTSSSFADASATTKAIEKELEPEPVSKTPDFIDPKKGAQYYLDRYNDEPAYKKWFDSNFPDYTIEEAIELAIPGSFSDDSAKPILSFVDPKKDPQYYIDRYNNEAAYKKWFDANFPDYTIFEAVGVEEPDVAEEPDEIKEPEVMVGVCGPGTVLVDGYCKAEESKSGGGCLIATATFGSELSPQVQSLRELRDNTLLQTNSGSSFMNGFNQFYYLFSPTVADIERENPLFKEAVKITITPMISSLSILNYADIDSEQEVLVYGLGVILLNIGMYFALPIFAILTVKRNLCHKSSRN